MQNALSKGKFLMSTSDGHELLACMCRLLDQLSGHFYVVIRFTCVAPIFGNLPSLDRAKNVRIPGDGVGQSPVASQARQL